ncbi:DUF2971 domain-containing protein [Thomasclavelia cocleata]|uniref:DUF2971 domain-containing protein n=1 Tax=Thomasclavelia cocleata TaxID=69824 RepID=UPI00242F1080|nr:DUF2971 domain-containing protein [Thomasclavelia cocleata]
MKKELTKNGGLLYQYRPCRRDSTTIYDIENIRHDVVYSQTPLNMNDLFDSKIAFSNEKIYDNIISMMLDTLELEKEQRRIIFYLIKYRILDQIGEFILLLKELKTYIQKKRLEMHLTTVPLKLFVTRHLNNLFKNAPKRCKIYGKSLFYIFAILVEGMEEISEDSINSMVASNDFLDKLQRKIEKIHKEIYIPKLKEFLSSITISCFSSSGWDNQLMWAHYARSYSGICIEYDFNEMNEFIGFIYPVLYDKDRLTITMQTWE